MNRLVRVPSLALSLILSCPAWAQSDSPPVSAQAPSADLGTFRYAYLADLSLAAPVIADVTVSNAFKLGGDAAIGTPPGRVRYLIEAKVNFLIRGAGGLPPMVSYLIDLPDSREFRASRLKRQRFLIFVAQVPGKPSMLTLITRDAQIAWQEPIAAQVREIVKEALAPDAAPRITGIGDVFHVPGSLPGESETQIFLKTADRRPVSLSILRRPGEQPAWALALGEIVDEAARHPAPNTLLWYRLACGLPPALPNEGTAQLSAEERQAAAADYQIVLSALGPCDRSPPAG